VANNLENRVALVTGAGRGIGQAVAAKLAAAGARVAVNDLDPARAEESAREIGSAAKAFAANVADKAQVDEMVASIGSELGPVSILVNNAGMDHAASILDIEEEEWDRFMNVNLKSVYLCTRAVLPGMIDANYGRVVSMASQVAEQGAINGGIHYATTKAGILGFTRTLARQMAKHNITANAVAPGVVNTDLIRENVTPENLERLKEMIPLGRLAEPADIGHVIAFLVSPAGSYITGATIDVNGGMRIG